MQPSRRTAAGGARRARPRAAAAPPPPASPQPCAPARLGAGPPRCCAAPAPPCCGRARSGRDGGGRVSGGGACRGCPPAAYCACHCRQRAVSSSGTNGGGTSGSNVCALQPVCCSRAPAGGRAPEALQRAQDRAKEPLVAPLHIGALLQQRALRRPLAPAAAAALIAAALLALRLTALSGRNHRLQGGAAGRLGTWAVRLAIAPVVARAPVVLSPVVVLAGRHARRTARHGWRRHVRLRKGSRAEQHEVRLRCSRRQAAVAAAAVG